jgi:CRP-like cAMP-binding protein
MKLKLSEQNYIKEVFNKHKLFKKLSSKAQDLLVGQALVQKVKKDSILWSYGDAAEFCTLVAEGLFSIIRPSTNDQQYCLGLFGPGNMMGLSAVLKKTEYLGTARSLHSNGVVIKFYIKPLLLRHEAPEYFEISNLIRELSLIHEQILLEKIDITNAGMADAKISELIIHLYRRFGIKRNDGSVLVPYRIGKTLAANLIDVRPETAIRMINQLEKKGLIQWNSTHILIPNLNHFTHHRLR